MKAVILCGGLGTRIREASDIIPKPMLPIGGKPIVWHIMKTYASHGVREFVLCLGYRAWVIKEFFLNYETMMGDVRVQLGAARSVQILGTHDEDDWVVTLAETGEHTQTGGRVLAVRRYLEETSTFLLTYGDGVADVDVTRLIEFHRRHGRVATVTAVRPPGRFGEIDVDHGHVRSFAEKPQVSAGYINGGFFVFDGQRIWDYLGAGSATVLEREPMQRLASAGELMAFEHHGFWQPMDTPREYTILNDLWASGTAPWKIR